VPQFLTLLEVKEDIEEDYKLGKVKVEIRPYISLFSD
jgi:hypothetical protein